MPPAMPNAEPHEPAWDDPRLTAYALGELAGPEHDRFAARCAADPRFAAAVAEIRQLTDRLSEHFAAEPLPTLPERYRQAILAAASNTAATSPAATAQQTTTAQQPTPTAATGPTGRGNRVGGTGAWGIKKLLGQAALAASLLLLLAASAAVWWAGDRPGPLADSLPATSHPVAPADDAAAATTAAPLVAAAPQAKTTAAPAMRAAPARVEPMIAAASDDQAISAAASGLSAEQMSVDQLFALLATDTTPLSDAAPLAYAPRPADAATSTEAALLAEAATSGDALQSASAVPLISVTPADGTADPPNAAAPPIQVDLVSCPWDHARLLARLTIQSRGPATTWQVAFDTAQITAFRRLGHPLQTAEAGRLVDSVDAAAGDDSAAAADSAENAAGRRDADRLARPLITRPLALWYELVLSPPPAALSRSAMPAAQSAVPPDRRPAPGGNSAPADLPAPADAGRLPESGGGIGGMALRRGSDPPTGSAGIAGRLPTVVAFDAADDGLRFSIAVAAWAMKRQGEPAMEGWSWQAIAATATAAIGDSPTPQQSELLRLIQAEAGQSDPANGND